jgi:hypothetical protein
VTKPCWSTMEVPPSKNLDRYAYRRHQVAEGAFRDSDVLGVGAGRKGLQPRLIPGRQNEFVATLCEAVSVDGAVSDDAPVTTVTPLFDEFDIAILHFASSASISTPCDVL